MLCYTGSYTYGLNLSSGIWRYLSLQYWPARIGVLGNFRWRSHHLVALPPLDPQIHCSEVQQFFCQARSYSTANFLWRLRASNMFVLVWMISLSGRLLHGTSGGVRFLYSQYHHTVHADSHLSGHVIAAVCGVSDGWQPAFQGVMWCGVPSFRKY